MPQRPVPTLRVWSYLSWAAHQTLLQEGKLTGHLDLIDPEWVPCYRFLIQHMTDVIGPPPHPDASPLWVWVKPGEGKPRKPRQKWDGHVLLTLDVPAHLMVQSDFHAWNIILNRDALAPYPSDEFEQLHHQADHLEHFSQQRLDLVLPTWHRVFDLTWCAENPFINHHPAQQVLQGTLWEIQKAWVKQVDHLEHARQTFQKHWQERQKALGLSGDPATFQDRTD